MTTPMQKSLAEVSLSAVKWDYVGNSVRGLSSIVITVVLARLLGPEPFGLVAVAWLVIGLGNLVADLGMGPALVQRKTISETDIRYTFTLQVCTGVGLMMVVALSAPLMAAIFHQPTVAPVVRAMSAIFVLQTLGVVAVSLLTRDMDFRSIQFARIVSYLVGFFGLGIPLALVGFAVWSIVVAQLIQTSLFSVLSYMQVRHPVKLSFRLPSASLSTFGLKVLSTNLVNYVIGGIDTFVIGRCFDVVTLGLYNRAYVLVNTPMNNVMITIQKVLFPAYSRIQNDPHTVRRIYQASLGFTAMVMFPIYGCIAVVPSTVVDGLFGRGWEDAIPFLMPLAIAMPFHALMGTGGPMLWAQDRVGREFVVQLTTALFFFLVLLAASRISATATAWGVLAAYVFRFAIMTQASMKSLGVSWTSLFRLIKGNIFLTIVVAGVVSFSDSCFLFLQLSASLRLALSILVGVTALGGFILSFPRLVFSDDMCWLLAHFTSHLPMSIRPVISRISHLSQVNA